MAKKLSIIDTLIYDRTQADVARVYELTAKGLAGMTEAERAEFRAGMKGAYNASDMNRVTDALNYLQDELAGYGYSVTVKPIVIHHVVPHFVTDENGQIIVDEEGYATVNHIEEWDDTTWIDGDARTAPQMETYLSNVAAIRGALTVFRTTPQTPPAADDLQQANDIEKILVDVQAMIEQVAAGFWRSDAFTMWSGADHLPSYKSYLGRTWAELDAMNTNWSNWDAADWFLLLYGNLQAEGEYQNDYVSSASPETDLGRTWAQLDAMDTAWKNWQVANWYLLLYGNLQAEGTVT